LSCLGWRVQQKHVDEVIEASSKFSKDTEEKIIQKMELSLKQREQQLERVMERLQKHVITPQFLLFITSLLSGLSYC